VKPVRLSDLLRKPGYPTVGLDDHIDHVRVTYQLTLAVMQVYAKHGLQVHPDDLEAYRKAKREFENDSKA
jgi:hypothetical protein